MPKTCTKCKTEKGIGKFYRNASRKGGRTAWCRACTNFAQAKYKEANRIRISERTRKARQERTPARIEKDNQYGLDYRKKNQKRLQKWHKDNYVRHFKEISARKKKYYEANKDKELARQKEYKKRPHVAAQRRANKRRWYKKHVITDTQYVISERCRTRIRIGFKEAGVKKKEKTEELIGCSFDFLRKHLESQWTVGMSWESYGNKPHNWVVDHIIPIASFDLTIKEERLKCFHWSNQWPLWYLANAKKSNKICTEEELAAYRAYPQPKLELKSN